ncbi:non-ribosomal peptide synthetase [Pseudomonas sp. S32]|uniref:non-ribosomal peptide synthetase n=1 Tax=Pseudomonas sp. S32 TaxID=2767448 RepID=UPI002E292B9B|nr:non-ribosomal peptide synthetase [Pseudomonas sp. S32]MBK5007042.1 non-ribosomal peptide synthetase [Pseudomonas sp. S32]
MMENKAAALKIAERFILLPLEKRRVYLQKMAQEGISPANLPIPRTSAQFEHVPLSFAQQRQWFIWQMAPHSSAYAIPRALRLHGALDLAALEGAFAHLIARHEPLRSTFHEHDGQAVQVIAEPSAPNIVAEPLACSVDPVQRDQQIRAAVEEETQRPFDLGSGPLLRVKLLRLAADDHVLVLTQHHIVSDGWSMQIMVDELIRVYAALSTGGSLDLPALPIQYADYAIWQRHWMEAGEQERQLSYWREQLGAIQPVLELPTDYPRPAVQSMQGARLQVPISRALSDQLSALAQQQGASMFMLLLASLHTLLYRYSGQQDLRIGVPLANRNRVETERLIGFFVNTQIIKAELHGELSFLDLLAQVRATTLQAQQHQELPFEQLVEALQPERSLSYNPLFQVMYNHQSAGKGASQSLGQLPGLSVESLEWEIRSAHLDLTLDTVEGPEGLSAKLVYATDLFSEATAQRLVDHWLNLLRGIAANPAQTLGALPLLSDAEQRTLLLDGQPQSDAQAPLVHQRIAEQARLTPDAPAVLFGDRTLTFAQLDQQANRLAHALVARGVCPETRVAVALPRSENMIVALLAVLKAGGAYVPLDSQYPRERLAYLMGDAGIGLLLTDTSLQAQLPLPEQVAVLLFDSLDLSALPHQAPEVNVDPRNLAYVIYTSGSTGLPKGVAVSHGPLAMHCRAIGERYEMRTDDCELLFMSFAFDGAQERWLTALTHGARLLVRDDSLWTPEQTCWQMHEHGVTVAAFPPVYLQQLAEHAEREGNPPAVRVYCFGGDAVPQASFELVKRVLRPQYIINGYGPTETVVTPLIWKAATSDVCAAAYAPIGTRIGHRRTCILNLELNLLPPGAKGELYLGGEGLARGYLDRPSLTAERFVPDPFDGRGGRLYRTGDLVSQRQDGVFDYLGRIDNQVKIRGFRIELGEVEARLQGLVEVVDAVVAAQDGNTGKQLIGYVIAQSGTAREGLAERLRGQLKALLPDYMVPTHILFVERFPVTPNGKLDRKALPKPDTSLLQHSYVAPRTELEQRIAEIWQTVLKLERVGLSDNFFELGGDSIISIQVVSRARQIGIRFTPKDLFLHQTVEGLATVAQVDDGIALIDQGPVTGPITLLPVQQAFFAESMAERHHWNQAVLLQPQQALDAAALGQALDALLEHHDALRLRFVEQDGVWSASHGETGPRPQLLWQASPDSFEALYALANQAQASLDLASSELVRAVLATLPDGSQRLLLAVHHLVVDGVSWRILFEDLQSAYQQIVQGQTVRLPAKTSAYQTWAAQLQAHAQSPLLLQELEGWQQRLRGAPEGVPCKNLAASQEKRHAVSVYTVLDKDLTSQLLQRAPAAYRTQVNDLLLTALAQVLCDWSGHGSALVQLEGHGREALDDAIDLTRTVGWFTSVFPVHLAPAADIGSSIKRIKEQLRAAPNKGLGFGVLRYLAGAHVRQAIDALPVPRVTFNYLGQFDGSFDAEQGALFTPAQESAGEEQSPSAPLGNWLTVNGRVYDGELSLSWTFSGERFEQAAMQALADAYGVALRRVVEHCCQADSQGVTPSDFPLARLTQAQLDSLGLEAGQIEDIYPLSPMQQGMLFHSLYEQGDGHYINQLCLEVRGLDPQRFVQAWQAMLDRHDILRTGFVWGGLFEQPVQVVRKHLQLPYAEHDWRHKADQQASMAALLVSERERGFDVAQAPLLRLVLVRTGEDCYQVVYTNHHVLMDGWSNSQLLGEVLQHYAGQPAQRQPGRFRDYIGWLQQRDAVCGKAFWDGQLRHLGEPTRLVPAMAAGKLHGLSGHGHCSRLLDQATTQRLADFARQQRITLNTLVQAAWLLLLQRYTGLDTVVFGATVAGRPAELKGVEQQIGLFINTLPVIAPIRPELRLGAWLQALQNDNLVLREHEHTALFDVQRWAGLEGQALFDNLLVFENYPVSQALREGAPQSLEFGDVDVHEQTNYPLTLAVNLGQTLSFTISYDRACVDEAGVERLLGQIARLLLQMSGDAERALGDFQVLEADEHDRIIRQWNATDMRYPDEFAVHRLFEGHAHAQPEAIALISGERSLSYKALNQCANRLALDLAERGVGPDVLVGVAAERSLEMVIALLAILKAGGAYVPLDPEYPQDRLAYMIEDSGIELLLTQAHLRVALPVGDAVRILTLDGYAEVFDGDLLTDPCVELNPENLAYVIYTSGSTGKPKGAGNPHRGLSNRLYWMQQAYPLAAHDCVLQKTPFSFDVSVWEFFWPLMTGARLVMAAPGDHREPARLVAVIEAQQVTTLHFVPSMLQAFMQHPELSGCASLRQIMCSGEALQVDTQQQVFERLPQVGLYNLYGPTEAAIDVTHWTCRDEGADTVPIGQPIANLATYVLDGELSPVPVGVTGELYLAGTGLARGYHRRPAMTAERFLASPFVPGTRLYRTGDLCRQRADGVIEYLGRADHQVKIRGLRIELGEIESRLLEQPQVREAVVLAVELNGSKRLVTYLVPTDASLLDDVPAAQQALHHELSQALLCELPDYMVPTQTVVLPRMPLSPNGKLDRKALPRPHTGSGAVARVAPRNALEASLVQIWQDVLGLEQVGVTDNFFGLGGDSIISIQLVSRARQVGIAFSAKDLFQQQTIEKLALRCDTNDRAPATPVPVVPLHGLNEAQVLALPIEHARVEALYSLSPMQKGMLFLGLNTPEADLYVNQLSIPVQGLDGERFAAAWAAVSHRHAVLRTGFLWQDLDEPLQFVMAELPVPLTSYDWRGEQNVETRVSALAEAERQRGFALEAPPLQRLVLVRTGEDSHQLIWTYHHILIDGWSTSQLMGEVLAHYAGQTLEPVVAYGNYIAWLRAKDVNAAEGFWRGQLARLDEPTYLVNGFPAQPAGQGHHALYTRLDAQATEQLKTFAKAEQVTLNTLVQGAWLLLLSRYSGQRTVAFGATMAGRPASLVHSERILGLFINTLPVIQEIAPGQSVGQWLRRLQDYNLEMREHEYTPLSDIQRWSGRSGQSLFDSIIVFENQPVDRTLREWSGESLRFGDLESSGVTNFPMDLMVTVEEGLVIEYMYMREHFSEAAVASIRTNMQGLLAVLASDAGRLLGEIGLPEGLAQLDAPRLPAQLNEPTFVPVHQRIAQLALSQGGCPAVRVGEQVLNFAELDARANALAHALIARGVGPEIRVGVAMPRNAGQVIALLAVLKAGAGYVPLDSSYPRERLEYLIQDSGIALLLTESPLLSRLPVPATLQVLSLDTLVLDDQPHTAPLVELHAHSLAYVIYTSGSTGRPKGVVVSHGPLAMHCQAIGELYEMSPQDCELHFMSFAFDGAHERWLTTLTHGGSLLLRDDSLWTAEQTYQAMQRHDVTVAAFPPAYLQQLAEHAEQAGNPPAVRVYCFGGDAVPQASYDQARRALQPRYIINGYGPTETVVTPLLWKAAEGETCGAAYAPIGRCVGTRVGYVLDQDLNPLPVGAAGELYLGGEGLARGYLDRAGQSAERFVADPFGGPGDRLYRTGDLVRKRIDGIYDYLGRIDNQVKIRGFRIELGEIEASLRQAPTVTDAVVVAREGGSGKQLVAYVVATSSQATGLCEGLRAQLQQSLPDYMVPAQWVVLDSLPLTPNGKVDRKALPAPQAVPQGDDFVAPQTELQRALAEIWQAVLKVERVGLTDNFYDLGGDSILSLQVIAKARRLKALGLNLKLRDLVQKPTIGQLTGVDDSDTVSPLLTLNRVVEQVPPLFCVHAGFGTVFDYEPLARRLNGKRTLIAISNRMLLDAQWQDDSLESMARDYVTYLRQSQPQGPYHLAGWSLGGTLALLMAAELEAQGQKVAFVGLLDSFVPSASCSVEDDWLEDLQSFSRVMLPGTTVPVVDGPESPDAIRRLMAQMVVERDTSEAARSAYAALSSDELANVFVVARKLKQLSMLLPRCREVAVEPVSWWVQGRDAGRQALADQIGQPLAGDVLSCGHFDIPREASLLAALENALDTLTLPVTLC